MTGSEELREALLSLQRENRRLRTEASHARLLLRSLDALLRTEIDQDPFPGVFQSLRCVFEFEQAMVLTEGDAGTLSCVAATPAWLNGTVWRRGPFLDKVLGGRVSVTFSNAALEEWRDLDRDILSPEQPAMYLPMRVRGRHGVLILLRPVGAGGFDRSHVALAREFSLLASHALGALHASQMIEASRARAAVAEEASRAKNMFIAKMSHELRTPLNAVIGFSELMKEETFGPLGSNQYLEFARHIHESGIHLLAVINDIIDISRIESGAFEVNEAAFDPRGAIDACAHIVQGWQGKMPRDFVVERPADLPWLVADERLIRQVLLNLVSNAFKFSRAGDGVVTLRAGLLQDGAMRFEVEDNGIGIPAADIPRLTEPFFQVDESLSRTHEGSGLGLSLVKTLIEAHGGTLVIESEIGIGTRVLVTLPSARVVARPDPSRPAIAASA